MSGRLGLTLGGRPIFKIQLFPISEQFLKCIKTLKCYTDIWSFKQTYLGCGRQGQVPWVPLEGGFLDLAAVRCCCLAEGWYCWPYLALLSCWRVQGIPSPVAFRRIQTPGTHIVAQLPAPYVGWLPFPTLLLIGAPISPNRKRRRSSLLPPPPLREPGSDFNTLGTMARCMLANYKDKDKMDSPPEAKWRTNKKRWSGCKHYTGVRSRRKTCSTAQNLHPKSPGCVFSFRLSGQLLESR